MYYVYVLKSEKSNRKYIGFCHSLGARLIRHNQGREKSTKNGVPWKIIYHEIFDSRVEAVQRERKLKSFKGGEALRKLLEKDVE